MLRLVAAEVSDTLFTTNVICASASHVSVQQVPLAMTLNAPRSPVSQNGTKGHHGTAKLLVLLWVLSVQGFQIRIDADGFQRDCLQESITCLLLLPELMYVSDAGYPHTGGA
jgi:hypothetical protein